MARAFRRTATGVRTRLDEEEYAVLSRVLADVESMLSASAEPADDEDPLAAVVGIDVDASVPDDPAVARLVPDAAPDDPEASAEFRRFTQRGLLERKRDRLVRAREAVRPPDGTGDVHLDESQAHDLLAALTDVRLVLGERLGLRTDDDAAGLEERVLAVLAQPEESITAEEREVAVLGSVYDLLTWWQESLADALLSSPPAGRHRRWRP